jgi:hypothetical protein
MRTGDGRLASGSTPESESVPESPSPWLSPSPFVSGLPPLSVLLAGVVFSSVSVSAPPLGAPVQAIKLVEIRTLKNDRMLVDLVYFVEMPSLRERCENAEK